MARPGGLPDSAPPRGGHGIPWEADTILPAQFSRRVIRLPEHRLLRAVLLEAIATLRPLPGRRSPTARELENVQTWIRSDDRRWVTAFCCLCEALGLDIAATRKALLR